MIQEWWGLVLHIEQIADRFADEGSCRWPPTPTTAKPRRRIRQGKLMMALRVDEAEHDLAAAIDYLASQPEVSSKTIGTVGLCMGGALSLSFAASRNSEVRACVVFYGGHPNVKPIR